MIQFLATLILVILWLVVMLCCIGTIHIFQADEGWVRQDLPVSVFTTAVYLTTVWWLTTYFVQAKLLLGM